MDKGLRYKLARRKQAGRVTWSDIEVGKWVIFESGRELKGEITEVDRNDKNGQPITVMDENNEEAYLDLKSIKKVFNEEEEMYWTDKQYEIYKVLNKVGIHPGYCGQAINALRDAGLI